eukprot:GHRR01024291.1.p1 GENE.GHRR01024291.1~~GHRR01024291.1.p1  ORF type:complete len:167 (+),score=40.64 GHRR01024291.1:1109-1609(+)
MISMMGSFACDETKQLIAKQHWRFRDHTHDGQYAVATLDEYLGSALSGQGNGIYQEAKHPTWHNQLPHLKAARASIEQLLVQQLHARCYDASTPVGSAAWRLQPSFTQSSEIISLQLLSQLTNAPLVLLMGGSPCICSTRYWPDPGKDYIRPIHGRLGKLSCGGRI